MDQALIIFLRWAAINLIIVLLTFRLGIFYLQRGGKKEAWIGAPHWLAVGLLFFNLMRTYTAEFWQSLPDSPPAMPHNMHWLLFLNFLICAILLSLSMGHLFEKMKKER